MSAIATRPRRSRADWYADVMRLRKLGLNQQQIADEINISRSFVSELIRDPDGSKDRARKRRYEGVCIDCGGPTSGNDGADLAPERCASCRRTYQMTVLKFWTRERIIDAIQRWNAEHGRPPVATDWMTNPHPTYPSASVVYRATSRRNAPFASWADAIEAAGFPRPSIGNYDRTGEAGLGNAERYALNRARHLPASGVTIVQISEERGVTAVTTRVSLLNLVRRGLLERDTNGRPHVYRAVMRTNGRHPA